MLGSAGVDKTQIAGTLPRPAIRLRLVLTHNNSSSRDKVPTSGASAVTTNDKWFHGDK